jgi:hypothetical protein
MLHEMLFMKQQIQRLSLNLIDIKGNNEQSEKTDSINSKILLHSVCRQHSEGVRPDLYRNP